MYKKCKCSSSCKRLVKVSAKYPRRTFFRGHRLSINGRRSCYMCNNLLSLDSFHKKASACKECIKKYQRANRHIYAQANIKYRLKDLVRHWAKCTFNRHRGKGIKFLFCFDDFLSLARKTHNCFLCGKKLIWNNTLISGKLNSPSLDIINRTQKNNIKNIQIICNQCNLGKSTGTTEEFIQNCHNVVARHCRG